MYAFRKPFAAATYDGFGTFVGLDLKTALVISQIIGYTLSKVIGMRVCSELGRANRALVLVLLIIWAQSALIIFAVVPPDWKVLAILLNGLPLGMIWGLVVRYLEGRRLSELVLAGLSCSYIIASGVVKDVGRMWMQAGVSDVWMPAVTGLCFLPLYLVSVWLLNQVPDPSVADMESRTERPRMNRGDRAKFVGNFWVGLLLLFTVYFFLTAYRDFRDNYGIEIFQTLGYAQTPAVFTKTEFPVAIGVVLTLAALNVFRNHRHGLIAVFAVMTFGLILMSGATLMLDVGLLQGRELWWMVLIGLGSYLAYVPLGRPCLNDCSPRLIFAETQCLRSTLPTQLVTPVQLPSRSTRISFNPTSTDSNFSMTSPMRFRCWELSFSSQAVSTFTRRQTVPWTHRRPNATPSKNHLNSLFWSLCHQSIVSQDG